MIVSNILKLVDLIYNVNIRGIQMIREIGNSSINSEMKLDKVENSELKNSNIQKDIDKKLYQIENNQSICVESNIDLKFTEKKLKAINKSNELLYKLKQCLPMMNKKSIYKYFSLVDIQKEMIKNNEFLAMSLNNYDKNCIFNINKDKVDRINRNVKIDDKKIYENIQNIRTKDVDIESKLEKNLEKVIDDKLKQSYLCQKVTRSGYRVDESSKILYELSKCVNNMTPIQCKKFNSLIERQKNICKSCDFKIINVKMDLSKEKNINALLNQIVSLNKLGPKKSELFKLVYTNKTTSDPQILSKFQKQTDNNLEFIKKAQKIFQFQARNKDRIIKNSRGLMLQAGQEFIKNIPDYHNDLENTLQNLKYYVDGMKQEQYNKFVTLYIKQELFKKEMTKSACSLIPRYLEQSQKGFININWENDVKNLNYIIPPMNKDYELLKIYSNKKLAEKYENELQKRENAYKNISNRNNIDYNEIVDCNEGFLSVFHKNREFIMKELLGNTSDSEINEDGDSALQISIMNDDYIAMLLLLEIKKDIYSNERFDKYINSTNRDGQSALYIAVNDGKLSFIEDLISINVDINKKNPINGYTALHVAAKNADEKAVEILIENGADKNIRTGFLGKKPKSVTKDKKIKQKLSCAKFRFINLKELIDIFK